jgi:methionine-rich copper-binding protein CopC
MHRASAAAFAALAALAALVAVGCGRPADSKDTTAPTVTAFAPASGATVGSAARLKLTFSEPMRIESVGVAVNDGTADWSPGPPSWSAGNTVADFPAPPSPLGFGKTYSVTVTGKDTADNDLTGTVAATFTVGPQPVVAAFTPVDGATDVAGDSRPRVTFNTAMDRPSVEAALAVTAGSPPAAVSCSFAWTADSTEVSCLPASTFVANSVVKVALGAGAKGALGDAVAAAASATFTVAPIPPKPAVSTVSPADGATAAARGAALVVTFSKPMDTTTAQAALQLRVNGTAVLFPTPSWDATATVMTVTPAAAFAYGDAVTWTVGVGAKDQATPPQSLAAAVSGGFHVVKLGSVSISPVATQSGLIYNGATVATNQAMVAGDVATNLAYRGFASFPLAASVAPTTTAITSAQLVTTAGISQGAPFAGGLGSLLLQSVFYDTLDSGDWSVATDTQRCLLTLDAPGDGGAHAALVVIPPIKLFCNVEWAETSAAFTQTVTSKVQRDFADTTRKGLSQFRLRFANDTDSNGTADYVTASAKLNVSYEYGW